MTQTSQGFPEISFAESVLVEFNLESATMLRFEVKEPGTDRLIGVCECFMAALVGPRVSSSILNLQEPTFINEPSQTRSRVVPSLEVFVDNAGHNMNSITFGVELELLKQPSHQSVSYVLEFRRTNDNQAQLVYRSRPVEGSGTRVSFPEVNASSERLCKGDIWRSIEIQIYISSGEKNTGRLVGSSLVTFYDLERCFARREAGKQLLLKLVGSDGEVFCGFLVISVSRFEERFCFLDYVTAGLDMNVLVGIDMTRSNGDPRAPGSLHSLSLPNAEESNEYVKVIREVVSILEPFDSDKRYPVFGFGAKLPPSCSRVSHCFALNGNFLAPEVDGIEGILRAYREALGVVSLHGPTKFAEVLKTSLEWASHKNSSNNLKYFILLLITDGAMEDLQASVDQIVELAHLPVSIIIVGVGDAENFEKMRFLDADTSPLISSVTGETMTRDIVQFVAFRDFKSKHFDEAEKRKSLAAACLEELPRQVTEFFGKHNMVFPKRTGKRTFRGFTGPRTNAGNGKLFADDKKTDLVMLIHNQGYDEMAVTRLLHDPGFMSADPFHVIDVMFHLKRFPRTGHEQTLAEKLHVTDLILEDAGKETTNDEAPQDLDGYRATSYGNCRVCYTRPINVAIKPCGHKIVCKSCLTKLGKLCPLCRDTISGYNAI